MAMLQQIRKTIRQFPPLRNFVAHVLIPSGLYDKTFMNMPIDKTWRKRIDDAVKCKDNDFIPRVKEAGSVKRGKQLMHNGLKINLGSYYGVEVARMLFENKGVHEPQEERVFMEVLKTIKPGSTMLELGSFWAFYSMWFCREIKDARCFMLEPDKFNILSGKANFKLNSLNGKFFGYFVGKNSGPGQNGIPQICIDDFAKENNVNFIDILHCDIQGFEYDMLLGANRMFAENKIRYVFISTHSNELHYACLDFLKQKKFPIIASADKNQTYSEDGLIVAYSPNFPGIASLTIDLNS